MVSPIDKAKSKKKSKKLTFIIVGVCYAYIVMVIFHAAALMDANRRISLIKAVFDAFGDVFTNFTNMKITGSTIACTALLSVVAFALIIMQKQTYEMKKHDNSETVNGDAHFMTSEELAEYNMRRNEPFGKPTSEGEYNMILSKDIMLGLDGRATKRNCNVLCIGGSGAGKSRYFASPNILQYNSNFVITDPSGEMLMKFGKALENRGYEVKVFNLTNVYAGSRYNPFHYIQTEKDVFTLVNTLIKNTTPPDSHAGDPFWEKCEKLLLQALILYLWHCFDEEDQTFAHIVKLVDMADVDENDTTVESQLDLLFADLEKLSPENLAVQEYRNFKKAAGKTLKSIIISVVARIESFMLSDIQYLTSKDDLNLESFADTKQALFVILPTTDTTFNFLASLMYSQLFSTLYFYAETRVYYGYKAYVKGRPNDVIRVEQAYNDESSAKAEKKIQKFVRACTKENNLEIKYDETKELYKVYTKKGTLVGWRGSKEEAEKFISSLKNLTYEKCPKEQCPIHVRFILDEFANIGQIPEFSQKLATIRKYKISCDIILQGLSQLKKMYKEDWDTITGNCDVKLYLGSDNQETNKWFVEMLGKRTTVVQNMSFQDNGSVSESNNLSSVELMSYDRIRLMDDTECIVFIRGVRPYYGKKYDVSQHPNYKEADALEGKFHIPVAGNAKDTASNVPLRLIMNIFGDEGKGGELSEKQKEELEKKKMAAKSAANRAAAHKAKSDLDTFDEDADAVIGMIDESLSGAVGGIEPGTPREVIKDICETLLEMEEPTDESFIYSTTD